MSIKVADASFDHLYPPFAAVLKLILAQATHETTGKHGVSHWVLVEGHRSQARQDWLYAQGRTRPGDIVTHAKVSNHTGGLAGDCYPVDIHGNVMWDAPQEIWQQYGHCIRSQHGVQWGGDWGHPEVKHSFVDLPHVEPTPEQKHLWADAARSFLKGLHLI